jgi:hypothetical protein
VSAADDLWVELIQFDADVADGLWDGQVPPGDAPAWSHDLATLVTAARGPARPDELAGEAAVVARMRDAVAGSTPPVSPGAARSPSRARVQVTVGVATVKVVGAVVAAAAAAATTGVVVSLVAPHGADPSRSQVEAPPAATGGAPGGAGSGAVCPGAEVACPKTHDHPPDAGALRAAGSSAEDGGGTAPGAADGGVPGQAGTGGVAPADGGADPADPADDPGAPPASDGGGTPPGQGGTPPGQGGTPPGQAGTPPGQGGTPPGQAGTPPGQGGTPPGQAGTPPGHGGTPPGQGGTPPGQAGGGGPPGAPDPPDPNPARNATGSGG